MKKILFTICALYVTLAAFAATTLIHYDDSYGASPLTTTDATVGNIQVAAVGIGSSVDSKNFYQDNGQKKKRVVQINSSATNSVDDKYYEVFSTAGAITQIQADIRVVGSTSSKTIVVLAWAGAATATPLSIQLKMAPGYDGANNSVPQDVVMDFPANMNITRVRIYRRIKVDNTSNPTTIPASSGSNYGDGTTVGVAALLVTTGNSTPSNDATLSGLTYGGTPVPNFSSTQTTYNVALPAGTTQCPTVSATPTASNAQAVVTYDPTNRSLPNTVTITVTAPDGTTTKTYTINFTVGTSQTIPVTGISLNKTETTLTVGETETLVATIQPANATNQAVSWRSTNEAVATVDANGVVTAVAEGTTFITVTSTDGNFGATCTVTVNPAQVTPPTPPATTLALHQPYIYEDPIAEGGYGGTLVQYQNRDWEVYVTGKHKKNGNSKALAVVATTFNPQGGSDSNRFSDSEVVTTNETETSCEAKDGWFEVDQVATSSTMKGAKDMFVVGGMQWKLLNGHYLELHVQGYDNFAIYGSDNNADASKGKHFTVYVDGVQQNMTLSGSETVRYFPISTDEHVIKVEGTGSGNNNLYGFALRPVAGPRVKYISGNNTSQVINQTESLDTITYIVRNATSWRMDIVPAANGITATQGVGDTVYVHGVANCPVGDYDFHFVLNDNIETTVGGHFSVKTELRPQGNTDVTANINEQMTPIVFNYIALDASGITCTLPDNLQLSIDPATQTVSISGTPTQTYEYTISIAGGNSITGTITVHIPDAELIALYNKDVRVKNLQAMPLIQWRVKYVQEQVSVTGLPAGVTANCTNSTVTISGTPNVSVASYPVTYTYTITAKSFYTNNNVTATGTITILDPNALSLLYLNFSDGKDALYDYLLDRYIIQARPAEEQLRENAEYSPYDVIIISEDASAVSGEVLGVVNQLRKPVLNMQPYTYTKSRLDWGKPNAGSVSSTKIKVLQPLHPVFNGLNVRVGEELQVLDTVIDKGLMSVDVTLQNSSYALASSMMQGEDYYADAQAAVFLHEVQDTRIGGKYVLFPLAINSAAHLTDAGKRLLENTIDYLYAAGNPVSITLPTLCIASFMINGVAATIDEASSTIRLQLPAGTDLSALMPDIQLLDNATYLVQDIDQPMDFSDQHYGVTFTVTDLIHRRDYTAYVSAPTDIEESQLSILNSPFSIYNALGQLIATNCQFSILNSQLPTGLYLIVTADGQTYKLMHR